MPNTASERQLFRISLRRVLQRYSRWVEGSRHLQPLFTTDEEFDKVIHVMDPLEFELMLQSRKYRSSEGCALAALTVGKRNDYVNTDSQRMIYFRRDLFSERSAVHELFHFLTHPAFTEAFKGNIEVDEGFTEYFTMKVIAPSSDPALPITPASVAAAAASASASSASPFARPPEGPKSAYEPFLRKANQTRTFLKENIIPMLIQDQREDALKNRVAESSSSAAAAAAAGGTGRQRSNAVSSISYSDFTKRAYFAGDPEMIKIIKDQWT